MLTCRKQRKVARENTLENCDGMVMYWELFLFYKFCMQDRRMNKKGREVCKDDAMKRADLCYYFIKERVQFA